MQYGGNLTKAAQNKLFSMQKMFLLQITRRYIESFSVMLSMYLIPPIFLTIKFVYQK